MSRVDEITVDGTAYAIRYEDGSVTRGLTSGEVQSEIDQHGIVHTFLPGTASCFLHGDYPPFLHNCPSCSPKRSTTDWRDQ